MAAPIESGEAVSHGEEHVNFRIAGARCSNL